MVAMVLVRGTRRPSDWPSSARTSRYRVTPGRPTARMAVAGLAWTGASRPSTALTERGGPPDVDLHTPFLRGSVFDVARGQF